MKRSALALCVLLALAGCGASRDPQAVIAKARESMEARDLRAAEIALKDLIQSGKDLPEARVLLGEVHVRAGDPRAAEKDLRRALELGASADQVVPPLVEALLALNEPERVLKEAAEANLAVPEAQARVLVASARARLAARQVDAAAADLAQARKVAPDFLPAAATALALQAARGERDAAATELDALLARHPKSGELLSLKGDFEAAAGRFPQARDAFAAAHAQQPANVAVLARLTALEIDLNDMDAAGRHLEALQKIARGTPGYLYLAALHQYRRGEVKAAADTIADAVRGSTVHLPSLGLAGTIALAQGNLELAEQHARKLQEAAPNAPLARRLLAGTYLRSGRPEKAMDAIRPLVEGKTPDSTAYALAGEAALRMNDPAGAARWFEKATATDPSDAGKLTGLAMSRLAGGERERGLAELERAAGLPGDDTRAELFLISERLRDKQYDKALEVVDRLEKQQPKSALPHSLRGSVLVNRGDLAGARKAFARALELEPASYNATASLATLDVREGKPDDARARFETLLKTDPRSVQAHLALARIAVDRKAPRDEVLGHLKRARDVEPGNAVPALALAAFHLDRKEPREAIPVLQQAAGANPDRTDVLELLSQAQFMAEQRDQALQALDQALRLRPDDVGLHLRVAQRRLAMKDDTGALAVLRRATQIKPDAIEPRVLYATTLAQTGKAADARRIAADLRRERPREPLADALDGDIAAAESKWSEAADAYRKVLSAKWGAPVFGRYHQALLRAGREGDADAALRTAMRERPDDQGLRSFAGESLLARKRYGDAAELYRQMLARDANNVVAMNNLAWALHQSKDPSARKYAEQAVQAAPKSAAVLDTLGVILTAQGESDRAVDVLRQAVTLAPGSAELRLHLAEALVRKGDKGAARAELDTLLRDTTSGPQADAARALQRSL